MVSTRSCRCGLAIEFQWQGDIEPGIAHTDGAYALRTCHQVNRLTRRTHSDGDFRAKLQKLEMLHKRIGDEAAAFVTTIEPDFLAQQAGTNTDSRHGLWQEIAVD